MSSDPRQRILDAISPALPARWRKEPYTVRAVGTLAKPTVFLDYSSINHDGMPAGQVFDGYEVALVSAHQDYVKAEKEIDPVARAVIAGLDAATDLAWSTAQKRGVGDYLAWFITVQQISHTTPQE